MTSPPLRWSGFYLPEIHDIAPPMAESLDDLVALFPTLAQQVVAHLIVPNWQGNWPLEDHADFAGRLRKLGGTPVLHGWTHSLGGDLLNWLLYGHDNRSEFAHLDAEETKVRLDLGLAALRKVMGVAPRWFCAPRWQENPSLAAALAAKGMRGSLAGRDIRLWNAPAVPLPALNFDEGARGWRLALGSLLRRGAIKRLLQSRTPFRMVLHPDDLTRPATLRQIRALMSALSAEGWHPLGLDDTVALWQGRA